MISNPVNILASHPDSQQYRTPPTATSSWNRFLGILFPSVLSACSLRLCAAWLPTELSLIGAPHHLILDPHLCYLFACSPKRAYPCPKCPLYKYTNNSHISIPARVFAATEATRYSHSVPSEEPGNSTYPKVTYVLSGSSKSINASSFYAIVWAKSLGFSISIKALPTPVPFIIYLLYASIAFPSSKPALHPKPPAVSHLDDPMGLLASTLCLPCKLYTPARDLVPTS